MTHNGTATVSVIIPAYNAALTCCGQSKARCPDRPPLEILVIDDGSSDRTAELVARLPPPVRLLRKENGGPATARNLGACQSKGDWLALLDADDLWYPDKLRQQLTYEPTQKSAWCIACPTIATTHPPAPDLRPDVAPQPDP